VGIDTTFLAVYGPLLNATVTWEARNGKTVQGNPAYLTGVAGIPCNRQAMNLKEGGRVRFQDVHAPLIDPTDIAYLAPDHAITTLDRLTFAAEPTIPFIVTDLNRYYDETGAVWYLKATLTYESRLTNAP
jgi:hypothetical protein